MRVSFGVGRSLARSRTRASVLARGKYLKTIKSSRSSGLSRLSSVRKSATTNGAVKSNMNSSIKADLYSDLETAAKKLQKNLDALMQTGDSSLFAKKKESNQTENATATEKGKETSKNDTSYIDELKGFVKNYNAMTDAMSDINDTTSVIYMANLRSDLSAQSKALGQVGITVNKDGSLKIDEKKLTEADVGQVEALFGSKGSVSTKVDKYAESIEKNATRNLKSLNATNTASLSSGYNRYGNSISNYYNSRYNYKG